MFEIKLTERQIILIGEALSKMPYGIVAGLISELNRQIKEQEDKKQDMNCEQTT